MIKDEDEKPPPLAGAFANIKVFLVSFPVKSRLKLCAKTKLWFINITFFSIVKIDFEQEIAKKIFQSLH